MLRNIKILATFSAIALFFFSILIFIDDFEILLAYQENIFTQHQIIVTGILVIGACILLASWLNSFWAGILGFLNAIGLALALVAFNLDSTLLEVVMGSIPLVLLVLIPSILLIVMGRDKAIRRSE